MNSPQRIWNTQKANSYKNWGILILSLLVIYFVFIEKPPTPSIPVIDNTPIMQEVKRLEDRNNKMSALVAQFTVENADARKLADSLGKALRIKPKFIKGVDQIVYSHDTIIKVDTVYHPVNSDTSFYMIHSDPWIRLVAASIGNKGTFSLSTYDTLTRTQIVKNPLFGRSTREIIVRNTSPYNVSQRAYSWTTKEPKTWLSIGPYVGFDVLTLKPSLGVSVQYPLIQLKK